MRFTLPSQKTTLRILALIVFNLLVLWIWALLFYRYQIEVVLGIILIIGVVFSPLIPKFNQHKKLFRWVTGILILIIGLTEWVSRNEIESLNWILQPLIGFIDVLDAREHFYVLTITLIIRGTFSLLIISLVFTMLAFSLKNAFWDEQKTWVWRRNYNKIRTSLQWHPGRLLGRIGQSLLLLLIISSVIVGSAAVVNALPSAK